MALFNQKERRAYFDQRIDLEDWLLPVVYGSVEVEDRGLLLRDMSFEETAQFFGQQAAGYHAPEPGYGFVGRDTDILEIEKRLLSQSEGKARNLLFIRGMGGAGKTTLLHHLGEWWQTTRFVGQVFYFGYDEKAWNLQQIMDEIAQKLFQPPDRPLPAGAAIAPELMQFRAMELQVQQKMLAQRLRSERHLLILDNLESVTGENLAIQNTMTTEEQAALRGFLGDLLDGDTLVLLGSRGGGDWLVREAGAPLRENDIYDIPGLDAEAASMLAERILERHVKDAEQRDEYRKRGAFRELVGLLDGYPLPLEVVLANLGQQEPEVILDALRKGLEGIDAKDAKTKTESILKCIDYSHSNLSADAQKLLLCLAPFTGVIWAQLLPQYIEKLRAQPPLASLPFERMEDVLKEAANWGLLTPHEVPIFLKLQPIFPYFLRTRLNAAEDDLRQAIETAFREYYDGVGGELVQLLNSKDAQEKQMGQVLTRLEYENLMTALKMALSAQVSIWNIYVPLDEYMDMTQDHQRGLELSKNALNCLYKYSAEKLAENDLGSDLLRITDDIARHQLMLKQYLAAEESYLEILKQIEKLEKFEGKKRVKSRASTYHQLGGAVAQDQRQWEQAEKYYGKALEIQIEFNDRYSQASTYHNLGMVAQDQRQWEQAEKYLLKDLEISKEYNDEYGMGITLRSLSRLWETGERPELPAAIASVLGISAEYAEELLKQSRGIISFQPVPG